MARKKLLLFLLAATAGILSHGAETPRAEDLTAPVPPPSRKQNAFRKGRHFHRKAPHNAFFAKLTAEERAKVNQLVRSGNREELRKYMRGLMYKYRPEELKKLDELSKKFLASKDEKEKLAIKGEMKTLASKLFLKRQEYTRNNILYTERQLKRAKMELDRLKKRYENSQKNQAKIIEHQVEYFCLPPEKRRIRRGPHPGRRPPAPQGNAVQKTK